MLAEALTLTLTVTLTLTRQAVCISSDKGAGFKSLMSDKTMSRMGTELARPLEDANPFGF